MKYIFTAYIFLGTLLGSAQSATRVNATNAAPVTMSNTAKILWVDNNDPNNTIKASSTSTTVYTKDAADATFMKTSVAADSINAMKTTINNNQAATNSQFGNYYTKTQSDGRYLQTAPVSSVNGQTGAVTITESDPTVSATVKAITYTNVNNWNAAATASGKTRVYDKNGLISSNG
ncbi:hypothetical protein VF02_37975, partial [Nostoc linckia z1]